MASVACPAVYSCVAVGFYFDKNGSPLPLLLTLSGGAWRAAEAPMPADVLKVEPDASLESVACSAVSSCVAVGTYADQAGDDGLLLTQSGSSWIPRKAPLPANGAPGSVAYLYSVACPAASACTVSGDYDTVSGRSEGMLLTRSGTSWTAVESPVPAGAFSDSFASPSALQCSAPTSCVAAGYYFVSSRNDQGLLLAGAGASWKSLTAPLPRGGVKTVDARLYSLACTSASRCVATGTYGRSVSDQEALLVTGSGTTWTAASAPAAPGARASAAPGASLLAVTCAAVSACLAVGYYTGSSGTQDGLIVTGAGSTWASSQTPLPSGASRSGAILDAVTCATASCMAVGYYTDSAGHVEGLVVRGQHLQRLAGSG